MEDYLKDAGNFWFFPDGVASRLSQFRMTVFSECRIICNTDEHHQMGDIGDLCYDIVTTQGFEFRFTPALRESHARRLSPRKTDKLVSKKVHDNWSVFGGAFHAVIESDRKNNNEGDILIDHYVSVEDDNDVVPEESGRPTDK